MRRTGIALLLTLVVSMVSPLHASAIEDAEGELMVVPRSAKMAEELRPRHTGRLGTAASRLDTTWVGYTPGRFNPTNNWWSIWAGSGADGFMRPYNGEPHQGVWDWDAPVHGDSLQGWWPIRVVAAESGTSGNSDRLRPHTCISWGNNANYVINQSRGPDWQQRGSGSEPGWRTFGVDGVWHRDAGNTVTVPGVPAPTWSPIGGGHSAWMGLRAHGDDTHLDPLTGQAFNQNVLAFNGLTSTQPGFTDARFPGYGSSMDQMLYRDIDLTGHEGEDLTIEFRYRTNLSTGALSVARFGWFGHDPLAPTCGPTNPQPNNFISGMDAGAARAPRDSFMVYVGAGVDGDQWLGSDGVLRDVHDPRHRWFAEVLHCDWDPGSDPANPMPLYYKELLSVSGTTGAATSPGVPASFTVPGSLLTGFVRNGRVRLVFRVKTNYRFDDESVQNGFSSGGYGAVQVDDVTCRLGAGPLVMLGDFEAADGIDNDPTVSALEAWKSTGKPPAMYQHVEQLENVVYEDVCGPKGSARRCDMAHGMVSVGNHDDDERAGGPIACQSETDRRDVIVSPTIQFADDDGDPNTRNPHGLYGAGGNGGVGDIVATGEYLIRFDVHSAVFRGSTNGNFRVIGAQSYPAVPQGAPPGYETWGQPRRTFVFFDQDDECYPEFVGMKNFGLVETTNASGLPDSLRIYIEHLQLCYAFNVATGCSPTDGGYWDNVSLAIVDATPQVLTVGIWDWFQDAFPANEDPSFPGNASLFDTTSALIKIGRNIHPRTGDVFRPNTPGDSVTIQTVASTTRMDLVFRVLPGPGNYEPIGDGHDGYLRRVPTSPAMVTPNDGSWWDVYRRIPGDHASPDAANLLQNGKAGWDPNVWVSARCDTAEVNLYALQGRGILGGPYVPQSWMSSYHEGDPRYALLGVVKNRCFVSCATCDLDDIKCDGTLPAPDYTGGAATTTIEGTKIIPDGLLTPGAHVQYFFRATPGGELLPDTSAVSPQEREESTDGHRWQQFSVLPDRWKDPAYRHPVFQSFGRGPACLLVVDWNDRRGNERAWVGVADTIGATDPEKFGAHNGWHAAGGQDVNDPAAFVRHHGGSPGTTWDLYQVKGAEAVDAATGSLGSRLSYVDPGNPLIAGKRARNAPTPAMLNAYYALMLLLSGNVAANVLGPYPNRSDDDAGIIKGWLAAGDTTQQNRGIWAIGDGFVESLVDVTRPSQLDLLLNYFRADLVSADYMHLAGVYDPVLDLRVFGEWRGKDVASVYGLRNSCLWTHDVLKTATAELTAVSAQYEPKGAPASGYGAGIFKEWSPSSPWKALVEGWDLENLTSRNDVSTGGRSLHFYQVFTNVWGKIWPVAGTPLVPLDVPSLDEGRLVNFVNVAGNPMYGRGGATIELGLARADRVEIDVYDVAGRRVRRLADRQLGAGQHRVGWDGLDDRGQAVARGVYFTRVRYATQPFEAARKLTVLR